MEHNLKYVIREKDRYGKTRIYYRKKPNPRIRLIENPGTPEFIHEYLLAEKGKPAHAPKRPPKYKRALQGSVRALVEQYYQSPAFLTLDQRTRYVRRGILENFCRDGETDRNACYGDRLASEMQSKHLISIRDERLDRSGSANGLIKALRQLYAFACEKQVFGIDRNPAKDVAYLKGTVEGFHAWTVEEIEQFEKRHPIGTKARLALAIMLYTGQRRSDIVRMGPSMVRGDWLHFTQHKGRNRNPVKLQIPIIPPLKACIDATETGDDTWLITQFGKPFTSNGFGNWFSKRCREAGVPGSAHGLRKAAAAMLAEAGCTEREIMAITGHTTSKQVDLYAKGARQKNLAASAMERIFVGNNSIRA